MAQVLPLDIAEAQPFLTLRAKLLINKAKVDGEAKLYPHKLTWHPTDVSAAQPVSHPASSLTGGLQKAKGKPLLKVALRTTDLVLELESDTARDTLVERLNPLMQQASAKGKSSADGRNSMARLGGNLNNLKRKCLSEDRDLQETYQQLVGGSLLTDAEFWRGHQDILCSAPAVSKQRVGFSTAMIGDVRPGTDASTEKVTFKITKDTIQQIFSEKPHIKEAYQLHVPHILEEKIFWERYLRFLVRRKARMKTGAAAVHDEDEDEAIYGENQAAMAADMQLRIRLVDPSVNIAADQFDTFQVGYGTSHSARQDPKPSSKTLGVAESMFRDLNRHGAAIVEGLPEMNDGRASSGLPGDALWRERMSSSLDDLRAGGAHAFAPLQIKDPRRYFSSQTGIQQPFLAGQRMSVASASSHRLAKCFGGEAPVIDTSGAHEILHILTNQVDMGDDMGDDKHSRADQAGDSSKMQPQRMAVLRTQMLTCNELLRHLWSCFPPTSKALQVKAARLRPALDTLCDRVLKLQKNTLELDQRQTVVMRPVLHALEKAIEKCDKEPMLRHS
ncbi:hypothetical protein WJX74_004672 [Apatococcus lobatus]|uniref:BSD domain-containing protein n=1 Tax=Apatococcus lobatus TaxID=904363 RepID=A0AAW1SEB8_9CHLO